MANAAWADKTTKADFNVAIIRYAVVATAFILLFFVVPLVPFPELGWRAGNVSSDYALTRDSGEVVYQTVPAFLTVYFTIRAMWHTVWWHWERAGHVARMRAESTPSA